MNTRQRRKKAAKEHNEKRAKIKAYKAELKQEMDKLPKGVVISESSAVLVSKILTILYEPKN